MICTKCAPTGYCRNRTMPLVTDEEMTPEFVRDGRNAGHRFAQRHGLSPEAFPDFLINAYVSADRAVIDLKTKQEPADFEVLFRPSKIKAEDWDMWVENPSDPVDWKFTDYRTFYRDNYCTPCGERPRLHYRERHRLVLSLLRAVLAPSSAMWGVAPANDN